jgi:hypothetical protein
MFVTADGEENARKIFRRVQKCIKFEDEKRKQRIV